MSTDTATQGLREVPLRLVVEDRGFLLAGQVFDQVPFHVARFFVVGNVPSGEVRGRHAHRAGEQLLVALAGSLVVDAWSGADHQRHVLRAGGTALHVPPGNVHLPVAVQRGCAAPGAVQQHLRRRGLHRGRGILRRFPLLVDARGHGSAGRWLTAD